MTDKKDKSLLIAYILLNSKIPLTTKEICERANVSRDTVYMTIDRLESVGFITDSYIEKRNNTYHRFYTCKVIHN